MPRDEFVRYEDAEKYVRKLKADFGNGVSTLGLIHNATEEPLTFVTSHDWWGHIYNQQAYPQVIGAGHWGGFLHVKTAGPPSGSQAAVVYRGKRRDGKAADWLVAWDNPWQRLTSDNKAYAEIHEAHYFDRTDWGSIENSVNAAIRQHHAEWEGCVADVNTEGDPSPIYTAEIYLR